MNLPTISSSGALAAKHTVDRIAPRNAKIMLTNIVPFLKKKNKQTKLQTVHCMVYYKHIYTILIMNQQAYIVKT